MKAENILLTGVHGFVGSALLRDLENKGHTVYALTRSAQSCEPDETQRITWVQYDADQEQDYTGLLKQVDVVIHLAARVHINEGDDEADRYTKTNAEGTIWLARQAANAGVKRFIYLSTVKVLGEKSGSDKTGGGFREDDPSHPEGPYALSKYAAEEALIKICSESGMEYVIIRPPLVYGPGVKANFYNLIRLVDRQVPLPFKSVNTKRSLVFIENLCDVIMLCINAGAAANQVFLLKDVDVTLPQLINTIAEYLGRPAVLLPFPVTLLRLAGVLIGRKAVMKKLIDPLLIDCSLLRQKLHWQPRVKFEDGIKSTVQWYRQSRNEVKHDITA